MIYEVITVGDIEAACQAANVHVTPESAVSMRKVLEGFVASRQAGIELMNKVSSNMAKGLLSQEAEIANLKEANATMLYALTIAQSQSPCPLYLDAITKGKDRNQNEEA